MIKSDRVLFEKNMALLRGMSSPETYANVVSAPDSPTEFFLSGPDGREAFFRLSPGGPAQVHSSRDPAGEAARQVSLWAAKNKVNFGGVVVSSVFLAGFHSAALSGMTRPGGLLFVADFSPAAFKQALFHTDLEKMRPAGAELFFAVSADIPRLADELRFRLRSRPSPAAALFFPPAAQRFFPEGSAAMLREFKKQIEIETANRGVAAASSGGWVKNIVENLPLWPSSASAGALRGMFRGKTALVIGAGPSLDTAMPYIREAAGRCLLIAVGTALKPLLAAGIMPDLTIVVDNVPSLIRQFEGIDTGRIPLLCCHSALPEAASCFKGRIFFFAANLVPGVNAWLESRGLLPERLTVGGTVSLSAADAALLTGASNIVFIGLDLCLGPDGLSYAGNSPYPADRYKNCPLLTVPGNFGKTVTTEERFAVYIKMIGTYCCYEAQNHPELTFYNAATGGALIEHTSVVHPSKIPELAAAAPVDFDKTAAITGALQAGREFFSADKLRAALDSLVKETELAESLSSEARSLSIAADDNGLLPPDADARLAAIETTLRETQAAKDVINDIIRPALAELEADSGPGAVPPRIKMLFFYAAVEKAARLILGPLRKSRAELESPAKP
jgi:hypothetical protein